MSKTTEELVPEQHLDYLDLLRESGQVNMFGAAPYLAEEFGISNKEARESLSHWMATFDDRH